MKLNIDSQFPIHFLNQMKIFLIKINDKRTNSKNIWNTSKLPTLLNLSKRLLNVPDFNNTITSHIKYDIKSIKKRKNNKMHTRRITSRNIIK